MNEAQRALVYNLRSLSRFEHLDLSIGDEAADEIERLLAVAAAARRVVENADACSSVPREAATLGALRAALRAVAEVEP